MAHQCKRKVFIQRWLLTVSVPVMLLSAYGGCSRAPDPWDATSGREGPKVLVSFPPLYCFTKAVAGEHARVLCLTTSDPHEYSPDSQDISKARYADVLIYNGLSLDEKVAELPKSSGNAKVRVVNLGAL